MYRPQGSARQGRSGDPADLDELRAASQGDPEGRSDHPAVRPAGQQRQRRRGPDPADHLVVRRRHVRQGRQDRHLQLAGDAARPTSSSPTWWPRARSRASALTWDDAGNNNAYQTGRAAFIINPPSVYAWMQANDKELLANTALINIPKGPGAKGKAASAIGSWLWLVPKSSKQIDACQGLAALLLRADALPEDHRDGGRTLAPDLSRR